MRRALLQKRPVNVGSLLICKRALQISVKRPCVSTKVSLYIFQKEPYISATELCISVKEAYTVKSQLRSARRPGVAPHVCVCVYTRIHIATSTPTPTPTPTLAHSLSHTRTYAYTHTHFYIYTDMKSGSALYVNV